MPGRNNLENYQNNRRQETNEVIDGVDDLIKIMLDSLRRPKEERVINPTQVEFLQDNSPVKAYMGPGGSGKTIIGVCDIILKAMMIPGSKWFIGRRDYNDLLKTTVQTATGIMNRLPNGILIEKQKTPPMEWHIKPFVTENHPMPEPSSITWIGLQDTLGSYEYCGGFVDELDEVEEDYFWQLKRAIRYIPSGMPDMEVYPISGSFNPPDKMHWLYKNCTGFEMDGTPYKDGKPTINLHTPKIGENARNLRKGYYEEMGDMPPELIQRYQKGEWVDVYPGAPVFKQFNEKLHINPNIKFKNRTLFRFWDFGYNRPSVHFCQLHPCGWLQVIREYMGKQIEGKSFIQVVKAITAEYFPDAAGVQDYGDPAVDQHKDTGHMLTILREAGIEMMFKRIGFDISLALMRQQFEMLIEGTPAIQIHPDCVITIAALKGGYRLKDDGVTPHKDGFYDHLMDDLRYGIYHVKGTGLVQLATASEAAKYTNARTVWEKRRR